MSITVNELVALPYLRTRFLAGRPGGDRAVQWAHTCELADPWNWLGTGDLLLSDGYNFPAEAEAQIRFLEGLAQATMSGIALAEGMHAPPLTPEAVAAADAMAFPVLETAYAVPFVTVARTVAESNSHEASIRLTKIIRMYDVLRRAHQANFRGNALLEQLGTEAGARLFVVDVHTAEPLLRAPEPFPPALREALLDNLRARRTPLPTFLRLTVADEGILVLPVEGGERAVLVVKPLSAGPSPDLVVLQHVATIAALEVERRTAVALRRRETGGRLLGQLVDGTIDLETAEARLSGMGLGRRPWRVVCIHGGAALTPEDVQARLGAANAPHLVAQGDDELLVLFLDEHLASDLFGYGSDPLFRAGVSQAVHSLKGIGDAARRAAPQNDRKGVVMRTFV
jgi:purine catabolism regulator